MVAALAEMSEDDVLAVAESCADTIREAEAQLLRVAYAWAVMHDPARLGPADSARPGRERPRLLGGDGTPEVCEFAAAELGARIGRSPYAAAKLMGDALDLHHRLPLLERRVEAGEVKASYARHVADRTRHLSAEEAALVDRRVHGAADGRICWSRFEQLVEGAVIDAAPTLAREAERKAREATFAKKLRSEAHGMGSFLVRAPLPVIDALESAIGARAEHVTGALADPEAGSELQADARRVEAVLRMATGADDDVPVSDLLPRVQLYVHTYGSPDGQPSGVARVEGHGPVTTDWVRTVLGASCRFRITPVLDLAGQAPVDAYEIPDVHREAVHLMTPADTFPFAASLARSKQVDHTVAHASGGPSAVGNYGPMTTLHHRIKTFGRWLVAQPFPGIYLWRDQHGATYLVDHTGTRRLPRARGGPPRPPATIDIYAGPDPPEIDLLGYTG